MLAIVHREELFVAGLIPTHPVLPSGFTAALSGTAKYKSIHTVAELTFFIIKVLIHTLECLQKPTLINKWQECHTLPGILLSIQVDLEIERVEVNDW